MTPKNRTVERPLRKSEYKIVFVTNSAAKGWRDLVATSRNAMVDSWEFLTQTPTERTITNYPLKAELSAVTYQGQKYDRWQLKPTLKGSARIWYFVVDKTVYLEQVFTSHPNQTK